MIPSRLTNAPTTIFLILFSSGVAIVTDQRRSSAAQPDSSQKNLTSPKFLRHVLRIKNASQRDSGQHANVSEICRQRRARRILHREKGGDVTKASRQE